MNLVAVAYALALVAALATVPLRHE